MDWLEWSFWLGVFVGICYQIAIVHDKYRAKKEMKRQMLENERRARIKQEMKWEKEWKKQEADEYKRNALMNELNTLEYHKQLLTMIENKQDKPLDFLITEKELKKKLATDKQFLAIEKRIAAIHDKLSKL